MDILLKAQYNMDVNKTAEHVLPTLMVTMAPKDGSWSPFEIRRIVTKSFEVAEAFHKERLERGKK